MAKWSLSNGTILQPTVKQHHSILHAPAMKVAEENDVVG